MECKTVLHYTESNKPALIKSPLRYPGGKSKAIKQILELVPEGIDTLCSPFLGGGSIELACASTRDIKVFGYDAFEPLVVFWQELLSNRDDLVKIITEHYYPLTRTKFYDLQKKFLSIEDRKERASAFFALNRASFSGTTLSGGMSPEHKRFTESSIDRIRNFTIDKNKFTVKHADFRDSIVQHKDDFMYLDPPYLIDQKLYGKNGDMHSSFDHKALADLLTKREGWILSYNDCTEIRELYKGHEFLEPKWTYGMNNSKKSNEVLILSKAFEYAIHGTSRPAGEAQRIIP
ncbi:MAG: DNA adenine methylase [Victivallaceae bacterium]